MKFQYFAWNLDKTDIVTITEHEEITKKFGKVCWGRTSPISEHKAEELNVQIAEGKKTYAFLYATDVPKSVNADGNLWYIAEIESVYPGQPSDRHLIPAYYRDNVELEVAFFLKYIKPIKFEKGQTPKVPGQATLRYCTLSGEPKPQNLYIHNKPDVQLTIQKNQITESEVRVDFADSPKLSLDVFEDLIHSKNQIIDLKDEIIILKEYKELYNKIISTETMFSSEKLLENWISENIHRIFPELEIIDQQPKAAWPDGQFGRLDLFARNKETKDITIIEVKTKKSNVKSGYDQFMRYTSWVRKFKNEITEKYKQYDLKITNQPKFIIITDYITDEMKEICKDHDIALVKIFGGLGFDKVA